MAIETGINWLMTAFFESAFAGQQWIMFATIIGASLVMITREWSDWGVLLLPVLVGWKYFGMPVPVIFFVIASILFVVSTLSTKIITGSLSALGEQIGETTWKRRKIGKMKSAMNIREEMTKLKKKEEIYGATKGDLERLRKQNIADAILNIRRKARYGIETSDDRQRGSGIQHSCNKRMDTIRSSIKYIRNTRIPKWVIRRKLRKCMCFRSKRKHDFRAKHPRKRRIHRIHG